MRQVGGRDGAPAGAPAEVRVGAPAEVESGKWFGTWGLCTATQTHNKKNPLEHCKIICSSKTVPRIAGYILGFSADRLSLRLKCS